MSDTDLKTSAGHWKNKRSAGVLLLTAAVFAVILLMEWGGVFRAADRVILDVKFRTFQQDVSRDDIKMIAIDSRSLRDFSEQNNVTWPWPREFYALLIDYLNDEGARLVVLDLLLDEPDFDRMDTDGATSDRRLADAISRAGNVVLSAHLFPDNANNGFSSDLREHLIQIETGNQRELPRVSPAYTPLSQFADGAAAIGNVAVSDQEQDAIIRRKRLFDYAGEHNYFPSLAMAAWLALNNPEETISWETNDIQTDAHHIPVDNEGKYLINWYGKGGVEDGTFTYYSFYPVIRSAIAELTDRPELRSVKPGTFENKIVFVGASAAGLSDIHSTPMSIFEPFPGVEIHATILSNLIEGNFIGQWSRFAEFISVLLLIFAVTALVLYSPSRTGLIASGIVLLMVLVLSVMSFSLFRLWLPSGLFVISGALSLSAGAAFRYVTVERQKRLIQSAFSHYVQEELVDQLVENPEMLKLGGEKKEITVLFSDLKGFTSISESLDPEDLVDLLNSYLTDMTRIIFDNKGTLDKYIGDAIMAFWGAPVNQTNHAELACRTALQMIACTKEKSRQWAGDDGPPISVRYGINTGMMVAGNMGSEDRFNYTVMGDAVNLGARLEPANNQFGTEVIISEYTYRQLNDEFICRPLDLIVVKGKSEPVKIYELMADFQNSEDLDECKTIADKFEKALSHYYEKDWDKAEEVLHEIQKIRPGDGPVQVYLERIETFRKKDPGKNWDGVFRMTTK